ncbi:arylsulfatase [Catelliglobosispora koreensis]|uniref:arylsulfatase n=1 Tax=Catelliglobosispora koreensis TaxID=129052 RepID=UPI00038259E5|nr:arylsulfatase [Catelliglobosispora koreensis]
MGDLDFARRMKLPIEDLVHVGVTTYDAKDPDTSFPPIQQLTPPAGAPNVLLIMLDDTGFGASSTFGGAIATPTFDRLASNGLRFNRFHTTALCSPTRQALLTGRNHHAVGMGAITELATSAPGYSSVLPKAAAPLAEILKLNGYSTAQFGKCHEVPVWQTSPMGPFNQWPTGGGGFEYFYGFIGGETNQWAPSLYENTIPVEQDRTPEQGYHFTEDMTDHAVEWMRQQKALMPDKPFFVYYAPGATHAPHHVPKEWADKYRGKFDQGWDQLREEIFARQKEIGVIPADAQLTDRPSDIPAWNDMPETLKPVLARQMEVYAGFLEHTDHHVGRVIEALSEMEILDETLVFVLIGDNGASAEGQINGTFNESFTFNGVPQLETPEFLIEHLSQFGTPAAYNHFAVGWAHAMDTPYQWTKQVASHWGGTRNGMLVHWPSGIKARGEIRSQFHHVIDIAATVLDIAGLPAPQEVHGIPQMPLHGLSMRYAFDDVAAPERHTTQYFEMFCNRGIYHQGWTAVTKHSTPWLMGEMPALDDDTWELYAPDDWTQAHDIAAQQPETLRRLQQIFLIEAAKYQVLPLDDRRIERFNADLAGRPQLIRGNRQLLFGGIKRLTENAVLNIKNKSHAITAEIDIPDGGGEGVIIAQGGAFGGWALYLLGGRPVYCYNLLGIRRFKAASPTPAPAGTHQVRMEFTYDGGGLGKGGDVALYLDGQKVAETRVEQTQPMIFSADETTDLAADSATPVSDDYGSTGNQFTGRVRWVEIDIDQASADTDHLISPEERYRIAMARQ